MSKKGDWLGKIAVVRDVVRCSDDVEGENEQPATENGKRKRQCGACRRPDPATYAARLRAHAPHTPVWVHGFSAVTPHAISLKKILMPTHPPRAPKDSAPRAGRQDISDKAEP